jgi:hypothetical protein
VSVRILIGDCRDTLRELPDGCVQTVVTSPPYFGLRDYGTGEWEGGEPACDHSREMPASVSRASTLAPHRPPMTVTGNQEAARFRVVASAPINPLTRRRYPVSRLRI